VYSHLQCLITRN